MFAGGFGIDRALRLRGRLAKHARSGQEGCDQNEALACVSGLEHEVLYADGSR